MIFSPPLLAGTPILDTCTSSQQWLMQDKFKWQARD